MACKYMQFLIDQSIDQSIFFIYQSVKLIMGKHKYCGIVQGMVKVLDYKEGTNLYEGFRSLLLPKTQHM